MSGRLCVGFKVTRSRATLDFDSRSRNATRPFGKGSTRIASNGIRIRYPCLITVSVSHYSSLHYR